MLFCMSSEERNEEALTRAQVERILTDLWRRGVPADLQTIRTMRETHPARPLPSFLQGPAGSILCVAPDARDALAAASLLEGQYWTQGFTRELMARAHLGSTAWVVARAADTGEVLGTARAVSDGARFAWILDVIVQDRLRGRGLGKALMALLLDHPALRDVVAIGLRTRDAQGLYARYGFVEREVLLMERKRALVETRDETQQ